MNRFLAWLGLNRLMGMNLSQRQNLTTLSMMGGAMAMTLAVGILVWIVRYSWPTDVMVTLAPAILDGLFNVIYGMLMMMGIMVITQASIALGGKIKGKFGPAELEASTDDSDSPEN